LPILKINMSKTFKRNKTFGNDRPRLNNHRDLPDYQENFFDEDDQYLDDEDIFNGKLYSKKQDVVGSEDEPTSKRDQN